MVSRILETIKSKGLSINAVEKALGFGNGAIKRFETSSPSIDKIIKLSNFLNVSLEWLVTGKEPNTIPFPTPSSNLSQDDTEILDLFHQLPSDKQNVFKAKLEGYVECLSDITAADAEVSPNTRIGRVAAFGSPVKEIPISEENYKSAMQILSKMENEDDDDE